MIGSLSQFESFLPLSSSEDETKNCFQYTTIDVAEELVSIVTQSGTSEMPLSAIKLIKIRSF